MSIAVHDEIVVAVHKDSNIEVNRARIEMIMVDAMQEFTRGIPVKVESVVSPIWKKTPN